MPFKESTLPETGIRIASQLPETPAVSPLQASLLLRALSQGPGTAPLKQVVVRLEPDEDLHALAQACANATQRFPVLTTRFAWNAEGPRIEPTPPAAVSIPVRRVPISVSQGADPARAEMDWLMDDARQPLDSFAGPCCRWAILQGFSSPRLVFTAHEVLLDDASALAIVRSLFELPSTATPPNPDAARQASIIPVSPDPAGPSEATSSLWARYLEDAPAPTSAPWSGAPVPDSTVGSAVASRPLENELREALRDLAQDHAIPVRRLLEAAWALLLHRCTGAADLLFATALPRMPAGAESHSAGQFLAVTPFRARVEGGVPFLDWARLIHRTRLDLEAIPTPGLEQTLAWGGPVAGSARVEMVFLAAPSVGRLKAGERTFAIHRQGGFPLTIAVDDADDLVLHLAGAGQRYSDDRLQRLLDHWIRLLTSIVESPTRPLSALAWMTADQQRDAVRAGTGVLLPLPESVRVHDAVLEQARRTPHAVAVATADTQLTYHELVQSAAGIAAHLRNLGVGSGDAVPLCCDRSPEMMVGLLGILMAGAAYAPLDPAYPPDRLRIMVEDLAPRAVLTQERWQRLFADGDATTVVLHVAAAAARPPAQGGAPDDTAAEPSLAYVIFTSGSTGRPKGVAMGHRPLANLLAWHAQHLPVVADDRTLQFASLSFDVSFQEIFTTWHGGGTVMIITEELRRDPGALWKLIATQRITRVFLPFIALQQLAEAAAADPGTTPGHLREVITAGEQLQITPAIRAMFRRLDRARLHNHYGPSETHVVTALTLADGPESWPELPSIGRPLPNTRVLVLDPSGSPQPEEVPGEIVLGGECLAHGYFRRANLTAERFVEISVPGLDGGPHRFYRTGDLGRRHADGTLEFLGRADGQVKIRGHRVELGEVECALGQVDGVRACAVVAQKFRGEHRLVAYFVPARPDQPGPSDLRAELQGKLPQALVPSLFLPLTTLPLTPSGKINRRALPDPAAVPATAARPAAPGLSPTESLIAGIWSEVLGIAEIGPKDHFFHLGGSSLRVLQVHRLLRAQGRHELAVAELFQHPTLAGLARHLDTAAAGAATPALATSAAARAARQRQALAGSRRPGIGPLPSR